MVCLSIFLVLLAVGVGRLSAAERRAKTVDCGHLLILPAGLTTFRAWAKGVSCAAGRALLHSEAVARGLPKGTFVESRRRLCPFIMQAANLLGTCLAQGNKVLVCGDGSAGATAQHLAAARSNRVVLATTVGVKVTAHTYREAAFKVIRALANRQGKKTSASLSAWKGGCSETGDSLLPGVHAWHCTLFDDKSPGQDTAGGTKQQSGTSPGTGAEHGKGGSGSCGCG